MKAIAAVCATLAIFIFVWILISGLIIGLAYLSTEAGVGGRVFWGLNAFSVWILSPFSSSAVAVYAATTTFRSVNPATIFVAFVSVCASMICILLIPAISTLLKGQGTGQLSILVAQFGAIFVGANLGRSLGHSIENVKKY